MRSASCIQLPHSKQDMAKRSDFAQKLLDDLRLRKERMAASQSSNRSKTTTIDAYAYSKQIHRGTKNTRTHGTGVPKTTNSKYGGGNKSLMIEDNSNQIVPYTRGRNSEQIGDLSMALAFALENGGKLRRNNNSSGNNLMLSFLHQISKRSFEIGKMNKRNGLDRLPGASGYFPTISHLHIKEISKGAQKLNQILRTCSNGLNFGKCSIEIGQELLKGAMDLEESLRMLVNLHDASEHMISPQQKNRIVLLEDEEDVEESKVETPDQKQLYQPRFSFDKLSLNSRSSREVKENGTEQKLASLRYTAERGNFNHEKQSLTTVKLSYHRKAASYGHDIKSSSTTEKVGISNVIAKLMGLDNLPDNSNSTHQDSGFKQKVTQKDMQPTARGSIRKGEPQTIIKEGWSNSKTPKLIESDKNSAVVRTMFVSQTMNRFPSNDASLQAVGLRGKPSWKEIEEIRPKTSPSTIPTFKQQRNKDEMRQRVTSQKDYREGIIKQQHLKHREPKATGRDENRGAVLKNRVQQKVCLEGNTKQHHLKHREPKAIGRDEKREVLNNGVSQMEAQMHKKSEWAIIVQGDKERTLQLDKRYSNKLQSRKQQKFPNSPGYQQPLMLHKTEIGERKHHGDETKQKSGKQRVQERNQKGSGMVSKISTKPAHEALTLQKKQQDLNRVRQSEKNYKEPIVAHPSNVLPSNRFPEALLRENACYDLNDKPNDITQKSIEKRSSRDPETKFGNEGLLIQPDVEKQHANIPAKNDIKSSRMQVSEGRIHINEAFPRKQGTPMFQEVEQKRHDKFDACDRPELFGANGSKEVEAHINESQKTVASVQPLNSTQDQHRETKQVLTLPCPTENECHTLREPHISDLNDTELQCQKTISISTSNQQDRMSVFGRGEVHSSKIVINAVEEADNHNMDVFYPQHLKHLHSLPKSRKRETLTESENHLMQTLITSEWFLNAAEALFKLNIPSFILHDSGHIHPKDGSHLIIDCSYEVMKRKGLRQELNNHPCTNISMRFKKIESLDDLIKQLHKDIEALKFYGRNGRIECEVQDYLLKMLESDIYNQEPDLNSMWDLGWNNPIFPLLEREEVARDVEKQVLSGLLDDVFRDLLHS